MNKDINKFMVLYFSVIEGLIFMACQPVKGYFMPCG